MVDQQAEDALAVREVADQLALTTDSARLSPVVTLGDHSAVMAVLRPWPTGFPAVR
jgi:hypothetical protein